LKESRKRFFSGKDAAIKASNYLFDELTSIQKKTEEEGGTVVSSDHHCAKLSNGDYEVFIDVEIEDGTN